MQFYSTNILKSICDIYLNIYLYHINMFILQYIFMSDCYINYFNKLISYVTFSSKLSENF